MLKICMALFALFCSGFLNAQIVISGKVTDVQQNVLPGAAVELITAGKTLQTISNDAGIFEIKSAEKNVPAILRCIYVGKKTTDIKVLLNKNQQIDFQLDDENLFLKPLEIQSVRASDRAPFTITNIKTSSLAQKNLGQDLPFLLNQLPSVTITSDAGNGIGYTGIRIRGTDATRINVTLNGIPYNDAESQGTYFVDIPDIFSSAGSIQVQRGIGTSTNGGGAFGATINLFTNDFIDSAYGEISNTYGSFNTWRNSIKAGTGLLNNHFTADLRLSRISSDGFIDRATSNLQSLYFSTAYINDKTSLRFNFISGKEKTYQAWYGVPQDLLKTDPTYNPAGMEKPGDPYNNQTDNYQQDHYQLFYNQKINSRTDFNIATFLTRGKGYYEEYKADQDYADYNLPNVIVGNDTIFATDLVRRRWLDNYFYGQIFSIQNHTSKSDFTIGGNWTKYNGKHFGEVIWAENSAPKDFEYYRFPATKSDYAVYAKWLYKINNQWSIFNDVQYRHVRYEMDGFEDNPTLNINRQFNFINPKTGISFNDAKTHAYLSYALAGKEPNRDDFEASLTEQPKPEYLHDFEAGIDQKMNRFTASATFYYMLYKDQLVLTGKINKEGSYTRVNVPNSYRLGLELQGAAQLLEWLELRTNATFSRNKIKEFTEYIDDYDNGTQQIVQHEHADISFSPAIVGALSLGIKPVKNIYISLDSKYVGKQYLDNTQNDARILKAYFHEDARIVYSPRKSIFSACTLILQVNNIFNHIYESNGATYPYIYDKNLVNDNYYYPMAGTNFLLGLNIKF